MKTQRSANLIYHSEPKPGKLEIISSKPCKTQDDLAKAYTPGVAEPCLEIKNCPEKVYDYTGKGNTIAVVSDGTAVLGLGNIGPEAGLPVMEGKSVLLKRFADIDSVPICLSKVFNAEGKTDANKLIQVVECLEPSFGGINLEDIASPACFIVEPELKRRMNIPVFHDDQHGTAIISLAALLNAATFLGKKLSDLKIVVNGAGAAGLSCALFYVKAGVRKENVILCDKTGVVTKDNYPSERALQLATTRPVKTLADALRGADMFLGCSVRNCVTQEMIRSMAPNPIVFAMANPVPEISPEDALEAGAAVLGTGRTDYPNQINNVLGFPGIFRGALDVRAKDITDSMCIAAAKALTEITQAEIPADILAELTKAYPKDAANGVFAGKKPLKATYVLPKPFDPRVVPHVARCVAEVAIREGIAQKEIKDFDAYEKSVIERLKNH